MDGSSGPPSDVTAMGSENDDRSKMRRTAAEESASASSTSAATPYPTLQAESEYRGQGSIRADSASPIPTTSSGCGCVAATVSEPDEITLSITPTTGGQFDLVVERSFTVDNLKKIISKRLKVAKTRIYLLHRERQLREGTLAENCIQDGSRLTLLPSVETGLLAQRPEQSVMQALESLNDSQVNDFLSGKAPLNLTMRLGDHMMLIQLQLSTMTPASPEANQSDSNASRLTVGGGSSSSSNSNLSTSHTSSSLQSRRSTILAARSTTSSSMKHQSGTPTSRASSLISSLESALHAPASCSTSLSTATTTTNPVCSSRATTASSVSSTSYSPASPPHSSFCNGESESGNCEGNHGSVSRTGGFPIYLYRRHHRHHHHHHRHHHHHHSRNKPATSSSAPLSSPSSSSSCSVDHLQQSTSSHDCTESVSYDVAPPRKKLCTAHLHTQQFNASVDSSRNNSGNGDSNPQSPSTSLGEQGAETATLDTRALAEASRNLTQKLKQLSSEENARRRQGAIIESLHHHGKGVYSGTFSGTLNPALQDRHGRPKRDISTIIHILNDLLCATPAATASHYRQHHRHSTNRQQSSSTTASCSGAATSPSGNSAGIGCHDSNTPGYSIEELLKENEEIKGKMRRLRLRMEQRRAKQKARRQARRAAYTTQWAAVTPEADPNDNPSTSAASPSAAGGNATEPQNEPEHQPCSPEPVVA